MQLQRFFRELKRRNVFRIATAYAIAGWLIIQICTSTFPYLNLPDWLITAVIVFVGIGFPISLIFAWAFELTPEGIKKSKEVDITASVTDRTGKKLNGIIITVLSMAVIFLLVERVFFAKASILEQENSSNIEMASIAVLPFVNMSGDQENEYFSDGLSEELLNALAKVEDLKVAGRTSSFKFKGQNENLTEIGTELKVSHILEGSVRKSGNRIRITAQLIKVEDGYHVWSEAFDRELTINNIFDIQEEISKTVMEVLKVKLLPEEEIAITTRPTEDIEAYNAFLEGTQLAISNQPDDIQKAIDKFKQAIRIDPTFAEAYARLAIAYTGLNHFGNLPLDETKTLVRENIDKALLLNGNLGRAYEALGYYNFITYDRKGALEAFERAVELMPNDPDVHDGLHLALEQNDRYDDANDALRQAYEKDPLNPSYGSSYANHLVNSYGEYEEATNIFDKMIETYPDYTLTYRYKAGMLEDSPFGQLDKAFELLYDAYLITPDDIILMRALNDLSRDLDYMEMADYWEKRIGELYPENEAYRWVQISNRYQEQKYNETERMLEEVMDIFGEQSSDEISQFLSRVYYLEGRYQDGVDLMEEEYPELLEQPVKIDDSNDSWVVLYSDLLEKVGKIERAQQLRDTFCEFTDTQIEESTTDRERTWNRWGEFSCMVYDKDYEEAIALFEELYFVKNSRSDTPIYFANGWELNVLENKPAFQQLKTRIMDDIRLQRSNVIKFLKSKDEWKDEWEVTE